MGRHGGGSRSGGSSHSSSGSHSGSRSGGSSSSGVRTSSRPFLGCYNRSYYYRGRYYPYYTDDVSIGSSKTATFVKIFALIFVTVHMILMIGGMCGSMISFGGKVDGDKSRIYIQDDADILTSDEEKDVEKLFDEVYDKSGMPITLITDDLSWQNHYETIEAYSEELYYSIGMDEDTMIVLFTQGDVNGFTDWKYDMYCGDDTTKCLSDETFDELIDMFQKTMTKQDLSYALDYSFNQIMDKLAKTTIKPAVVPMVIILLLFYGIFYVALLCGGKNKRRSDKYYAEHPEKLDNTPMKVYRKCPNCGADNINMTERCEYCGIPLKLSW